MTYQSLIQTARKQLQLQKIDNATFEAHEIICHCTGMNKGQLLRDLSLEAPPSVLEQFHPLLERRVAGEPLAYLLQQWDFYGLTFHVNEHVLIPRLDTEVLAQRGIQLASQYGGRVLDLCCGSGCVGIAVAHASPMVQVTLGDISPEAREVAQRNIQLHQMSSRISCLEMNALAPATETGFQLILSNPPYISQVELAALDPSVKNHEPRLALYGGKDGYDFYRSILSNWTNALDIGGYLVMEVGIHQAPQVAQMLDNAGYTSIQSFPDTQHITRVVEGKRSI